MERTTMDEVVSKQILDVLRNNQQAAQRLLDSIMKPGSPRLPQKTSDDEPDLAPSIADHISGAQPFVGLQLDDIGAAARKMMNLIFQRPEVALENITRFWTEQFRVLTGSSELAPAKDDHRFDDPTWTENPVYKLGMQTYLSLRKGLDEWVDALPVDHKETERMRFMLSLVTEALAPTNWPTNPAALKRFLETGGASAIRGLKNLVDDAINNDGMPSMVKRGALKVGKDLATTPGKVVHRSEVFELIQYQPATEEVRARPFLMVPPQINKYYFYDLMPKKSLIRFAVESGLQVFTVSWRNPTNAHRHWNFDTYISAIEEAIDAVREITGSPDCNIEGGCVGGITVAGLLANLAERGERKVNSATLMVTMLDTSVETQLGILATPATLDMARTNSAMKGVVEGSELGRIFAFLRPNDLIWSYWVNNYLLGNDPSTFDVLAWNADTSRMTAGFHVELLDLVQNNSLVRGEFKVHGKPVRLDSIDCDQFWMAGMADHITPWKACYTSARFLGGKREFVVSEGGHIQSMISSPSNPKARFYSSSEQPDNPDDWLGGASAHDYSWWQHWREWITQRSGELRQAPASLGSADHPPLADAPGTYVFE
jgi:polyhydroxyalkanoate synthase subunit PhaC